MPSVCCVPYCRGNTKNGPKVHCFRFPTQAKLLQKWIEAIPRSNFTPTKGSKVCHLHFKDECIMKNLWQVDSRTGKVYSCNLTRFIVYASSLILLSTLIHSSLADIKNHKKGREDEDYSVERPSKHKKEQKYKGKFAVDFHDDSSEEEGTDYNKGKEKKHLQKEPEKFSDPEEEQSSFKRYKRNFDVRKDKDIDGTGKKHYKKKKVIVAEEDEGSGEDVLEEKEKRGKENTKQLRAGKQEIEEGEVGKENKKLNKKMKAENADDEDDSNEKPEKKFEKNKFNESIEDSDEESEEEESKKQFRKKVRVRVPDSDESDESGTCERRKQKGKNRGPDKCEAEESEDGSGEVNGERAARKKRIKYSIKFAHEKAKTVPSQEDNIMLKIHRGDKKKYKYEDDDDDSSEEHTHPKRLRFVDDDED